MKRNGNSFETFLIKKKGVRKTKSFGRIRATFTYENAIYSRRVTDSHGIQVKKALLCCKTYHARRSLMYYQLLYPEAQITVCPACPDGITRKSGERQKKGGNCSNW